MYNDSIKISVLMGVYNTPQKYLSEAIDSILVQTYSNLEFVIVDDGSADASTKNCLSDYATKDDRIVLITNEKNIGLTKALNKGLEVCTGKYIARMDSDDISEPKRLEIQLDYMEKNTEVSMVGADIYTFGDDISQRKYTKSLEMSDEYHRIRSLFGHAGPPHPTFFIRKEFIDKCSIKYRPDVLKAQDYGLMADIYLHNGIIRRLYEPLLNYRMHEGQITSGSFSEQKHFQEEISAMMLSSAFGDLSENDIKILASLATPFQYGSIFTYKKTINNFIKLNKTIGKYDSKVFEQVIEEVWKRKKRKFGFLGKIV